MLETYALQISQGILTRIVAALEWLGAQSDDIGSKTQETLSQEPTGGAA